MTISAPSTPAVIPAYQAAPWIGTIVERTRTVLPEVLVVDDGSGDGTAEAAREAGAEVLSLPVNQGKGTALRTAFEALFRRGHSQVVTLDADGQHLPEEIPKLLAAAEETGADLVLGSREHLFAQMSWLRRVSNRSSSQIISALAGLRLPDVQTGFRFYRRRLLEATGFPESRFDAESTVVVRAGRLGLKVVAVPVELGQADGRSTSHYRALVDGLRIARSVVKARFERLPAAPAARTREAR
ncbi:MAG: glycosyltransferase family 2 protein [Acidobacteria bacterium]|nr:glycosyltransferase family 2 protein [Acidobacteriota bacterium]